MSEVKLSQFTDFQNKKEEASWWEKMKIDVQHSYPIPKQPRHYKRGKMDCCVDVGANVGAFSNYVAPVFKNVYAYEPVLGLFSKAKENLKDLKNVKLNNFAVAKDSSKTVKIGKHTTGYSGDCSIYNDTTNEYELCNTLSLEDVYKKNNIDFIDYLKIDCEGSEYDFLFGKDLSKIDFLSIEVHPGYLGDEKTLKLHKHLSEFFYLLLHNGDDSVFFLETKQKPVHLAPDLHRSL